MKRALVTGVSGQDGFYLSRLLVAKGYEVVGTTRSVGDAFKKVKQRLEGIQLRSADIRVADETLELIRSVNPDEVYNLAAVSSVAYSWAHAQETAQATAIGVLNLLEAIRTHRESDGTQIKFFQASSSEMFGQAHELPLRESTLLWPRSPYGVSKVFGHYMTINYRESYGMHASSGILFNHESPMRPATYVTRKITSAAVRIASGDSNPLRLGNIDIMRDWGYAGDYVEAMWKMLQAETADDFVIATGVGHTLRDFLDLAFQEVGIDDWRKHVIIDPALFRPADVDVITGNPSKANDALNWRPTVGFDDLVKMLVQADLSAGGSN